LSLRPARNKWPSCMGTIPNNAASCNAKKGGHLWKSAPQTAFETEGAGPDRPGLLSRTGLMASTCITHFGDGRPHWMDLFVQRAIQGIVGNRMTRFFQPWMIPTPSIRLL
jgi:hypothetical protein